MVSRYCTGDAGIRSAVRRRSRVSRSPGFSTFPWPMRIGDPIAASAVPGRHGHRESARMPL